MLITGLGLGCAARGCLANPRVTHVTVIERDPHVLRLVGTPPWADDPRLDIIVNEAVAWMKSTTDTFDCAWHDLWSDPDKKERHLQITHAELLCGLRDRVGWQGAWALGRPQRRLFRRLLPIL